MLQQMKYFVGILSLYVVVIKAAATTTTTTTTMRSLNNYDVNDDISIQKLPVNVINNSTIKINLNRQQQQEWQEQQQQLNHERNDDSNDDGDDDNTLLMTPLKLQTHTPTQRLLRRQKQQQQQQQQQHVKDDEDDWKEEEKGEQGDLEIDLRKSLQLNELLNIFDLKCLSEQWQRAANPNANGNAIANPSENLSRNCYSDMRKYLAGLRNGSMWAMKMDDASGHYPTGFYYGNNYIMGSMLLCKSIYNKENVKQENLTLAQKPLPDFSKIYQRTYNENPPFQPGFYVLRMILNETYPTSTIRIVYEGLCLPANCTIEDIYHVAKMAQRNLPTRHINITNIRSPTHSNYNLYDDKTFQTLTIITVIVLVLILSGSLYEIYLRKRYETALTLQNDMMNNSETSSGIGCPSSSDYGDSMTNVTVNGRGDVEQKTDLSVELKDVNVVLNLTKIDDTSNMNGTENNKNNHHHNNDNDNDIMDEHLEGHVHESAKLNVYSELLLSFSAITNLKAICDQNVGADTLASIHGLRAISMGWVILGHTCMIVFNYSDNLELRKEVETSFLFKTITNAPFSVDTFFFISGCLVSYLYFRTDAKGKLNKLSSNNEFMRCAGHFFGLVIYRFMRLTAPYMFVLGLTQLFHKYWAATSVFDSPTMDHINCPKYWWRNLLYINTLFPLNQMCMVWSWYLANDTQFYIVGAIILIIAVRHFKISAITSCFLLALSWIITAIIAFTHNHRPNIDDPFALFDKIYDKPWTRSGPYLIGMAVGWMLFRTNCKIRLPRYIVLTAWSLACLNLLTLVFGLYNAEQSQFTGALYSSLSHSTWALSLAWITIACSTGHGGYINSFLSAPFIYPFSRVTYCAYLVHPIVIRSLTMHTDSPLHLGCYTMAIYFFGMFVASYILAFAVSIAFEAPVVTMLKILSPSRRKPLA